MSSLGIGRIPAAAREAVRCAVAMEEGKAYVHYNHTDPCSDTRWTAKESYEYMYGRRWHKVAEFYSELVRRGDQSMLSGLFSTEEKHVSQNITETFRGCENVELASVSAQDRTGRWARVTFKIVLSYHGKFFDGWQQQPGLNTVQGLVESSLGKFVDEKKAQQLREKSLPVEGCAIVAGRTDKGVTALQQVCSFYTWRKDVTREDVEDAINKAAPGNLRAVHISEVSREFHPNFSAKWRRYLYIFPLSCVEEGQFDCGEKNAYITADNIDHKEDQARYIIESDGSITNGYAAEDADMSYSAGKPRSFTVGKVSQLLHQLEGKCLSYKMFSRDTKASRSIGPPTECFMLHARATETSLPCADEAYNGEKVMCVELVANRFLRKMVRVLVATAIREAAVGADDDALLKLMNATCRRATAPPAPPDGLCLVDVGYGEFKRESCLIL